MHNAKENWLKRVSAGLAPRDQTLLRRAAETLEDNIVPPDATGKPLPWRPRRGICPSPNRYRGVWNWDAAFHAIAVARWDDDLAREQFEILFDAQLPSGALPDVIFENGDVVATFSKPPVFPWAVLLVERHAPDAAFLAASYEKLSRLAGFWERERRQPGGLFHYDSVTVEPGLRENEARMESGWDNSVRWDNGQAPFLWAVDLNCYMVLAYRALAEMARKTSRDAEVGGWVEREAQLSKDIQERLYDPQRQCFLDFDPRSGAFSPTLSPACFMPLFLGIATPAQAEAMAALAADPGKFYPAMPTVAYDDPQYSSSDFWRGPTWLNVGWFALVGLKKYGYRELAETGRETILDWCARNEDSIYEYYDSRSGQGVGAAQYGWSATFIIEFILGWNEV